MCQIFWSARAQVELELHCADISQLLASSQLAFGRTAGTGKPPRLVDTVVMNPPFGTRKAGIDMEASISVPGVVYILVALQCCGHLVMLIFRCCYCNDGTSTQFLILALRLATGAVYSLHKSSTRAHVAKVLAALSVC